MFGATILSVSLQDLDSCVAIHYASRRDPLAELLEREVGDIHMLEDIS